MSTKPRGAGDGDTETEQRIPAPGLAPGPQTKEIVMKLSKVFSALLLAFAFAATIGLNVVVTVA